MTTLAQVAQIQDPNRREHFVYWAYNAQGVLLYVGCTMQPEKRLEGHKTSKAPWLHHVARYRAQGPYNYATARRMERNAIREHQPPFNSDTVAYRAAKKATDLEFERRVAEDMAFGLTFNEASMRAIDGVPAGAPRNYRPMRLA